MGKKIQRVGDKNNAGGAILQGEPTVRVNGKPIAVTNMPVSNHPPGRGNHASARTKATQSTLKANGKPVVFTGDKDTCNHVRQGGSPDVGRG